MKYHLHRGNTPSIFFYRDRKNLEVDLLVERGKDVIAVEIKSSLTPSSDHFSALDRLSADLTPRPRRQTPPLKSMVVYAGDESQKRTAGHLLSWTEIHSFDWIGKLR